MYFRALQHPLLSAYAAMKAAMIRMTKYMALGMYYMRAWWDVFLIVYIL